MEVAHGYLSLFKILVSFIIYVTTWLLTFLFFYVKNTVEQIIYFAIKQAVGGYSTLLMCPAS